VDDLKAELLGLIVNDSDVGKLHLKNYDFSGLCPLSPTVEMRECNVSGNGSVPVFR
jgi:hypothetical protein